MVYRQTAYRGPRPGSYNSASSTFHFPDVYKCFFALVRIRESNVGLRIGAFSSWNGFNSVWRTRGMDELRVHSHYEPSWTAARTTHLDVCLPDLLEEHADALVVFELVQDHNLDA